MADADVTATVEYQSGPTSYNGRTDADGQATIQFETSVAPSKAYIASVKVKVGDQAACETKFVVPRKAT